MTNKTQSRTYLYIKEDLLPKSVELYKEYLDTMKDIEECATSLEDEEEIYLAAGYIKKNLETIKAMSKNDKGGQLPGVTLFCHEY